MCAQASKPAPECQRYGERYGERPPSVGSLDITAGSAPWGRVGFGALDTPPSAGKLSPSVLEALCLEEPRRTGVLPTRVT